MLYDVGKKWHWISNDWKYIIKWKMTEGFMMKCQMTRRAKWHGRSNYITTINIALNYRKSNDGMVNDVTSNDGKHNAQRHFDIKPISQHYVKNNPPWSDLTKLKLGLVNYYL